MEEINFLNLNLVRGGLGMESCYCCCYRPLLFDNNSYVGVPFGKMSSDKACKRLCNSNLGIDYHFANCGFQDLECVEMNDVEIARKIWSTRKRIRNLGFLSKIFA